MDITSTIDLLQLALGGVIAIVGLFGMLEISDRISARKDYRVDFKPQVDSGTVMCDFVDAGLLQSIADQNSVPILPSSVERHEGTSRFRSAHLPKGLGRRGKQTDKSTTETENDRDRSNELLRKVLKKLLDDERLDYELVHYEEYYSYGHAIGPEVDGRAEFVTDAVREKYGELEDEVAGGVSAAALDAIDRYPEVLRARAQRERFQDAAAQQALVLVEVAWDVSQEDGALRLQAKHLRRGPWSETPGGLVPMPDEIGILVQIPADKLTDFGSRHLVSTVGGELRVKVFGMASQCGGDGILEVTPIAVYTQTS